MRYNVCKYKQGYVGEGSVYYEEDMLELEEYNTNLDSCRNFIRKFLKEYEKEIKEENKN